MTENKVLQKIISELEYSAQVAIELNDRYHKALEEIEEIVNEAYTDSQSVCKSCNFSCEHKDILDIISKAKEAA